MGSRVKVLLLFSKEMSPKSKTLVSFGSLGCNMDISIIFSDQEGQSFFQIVGTEQIVRFSFSFIFSETVAGVKRILKTVFELAFSKMT